MRPSEEFLKEQRDRRMRLLAELQARTPNAIPRAPVVGDHCPQCETPSTLSVLNESLVCRRCCLRLPRTDIEACAQETLPSGASGMGPDTRQYLATRWSQVRRIIHDTTPTTSASACTLSDTEMTAVMTALQAVGVNSSLEISLPAVAVAIKGSCPDRDPQWCRNATIWCTAFLSGVPPPAFTQTEMVKLNVMFRRLVIEHRQELADGTLFLRYGQCVFNLIYLLGGHDSELYVYFPTLKGQGSLRKFNSLFNRLSGVPDLRWQPVDCVPLAIARRDQAKAASAATHTTLD